MTTKTIIIRCPGCGRQEQVKRQPYEPASAAVAEFNCSECCNDDKDTVVAYYDGGGNEIIEDPAEPPLDPTLGGARPARLECDETGKPRSLVLLPSFMRDDTKS